MGLLKSDWANVALYFSSWFLLFIGETELVVACPEFHSASHKQTTGIYWESFSRRQKCLLKLGSLVPCQSQTWVWGLDASAGPGQWGGLSPGLRWALLLAVMASPSSPTFHPRARGQRAGFPPGARAAIGRLPGLPVLWVGPAPTGIPVGLVTTWRRQEDWGNRQPALVLCHPEKMQARLELLGLQSSPGPVADPALLTLSKSSSSFFSHQRKEEHEVATVLAEDEFFYLKYFCSALSWIYKHPPAIQDRRPREKWCVGGEIRLWLPLSITGWVGMTTVSSPASAWGVFGLSSSSTAQDPYAEGRGAGVRGSLLQVTSQWGDLISDSTVPSPLPRVPLSCIWVALTTLALKSR